MAQTVPPSFVDEDPNLRKLTIAKWEWPETAKNRGEPRKCPIDRKRNFLGGGPKVKVVAPGILVICPVDINSN